MRSVKGFVLLALFLLGLVFMAAWYERPGLGEYHANLMPRTQQAHPLALRATWLGTSAVLLSDGRNAVLVDPFFTRPPGLLNLVMDRQIEPDTAVIQRWLDRLEVKSLDAVLVSHSHFDHAMDAGVVARLTGARLVGSPSTLNIGRGAGLAPDHLVLAESTEPLRFGDFRIRFVPSAHAGATGGRPTGEISAPLAVPAHYMDYKQGGTYSIVIEHPQGRILHHGSAGFVPGALDGQRADVVFLGIAMIGDLEPYLRETVDAVGASRVIPVHWDNFTLPLDKPLEPFPFVVRLDDFFANMRRLRPAIQVQTLLPDRTVVLFPPK